MKTSEHVSELFEALAKSQGEIQAAKMDSVNPFFKSKYADLNSVWAACRIPLTKNGLSVIQSPEVDIEQQRVILVTRLCHSSGQWVENELSVIPGKSDIQGIGAVITYMRRYALSSMVGISADEDTDGNQDVTPTANGVQARQTKQVNVPQNPEPRPNQMKPNRPWKPEFLIEHLRSAAAHLQKPPSDEIKTKALMSLKAITNDSEDARHDLQYMLFNKKSLTEFTAGECQAIIKWVEVGKIGDEWIPSGNAIIEYQSLMFVESEPAKPAQETMIETPETETAGAFDSE